MLSAGLGKPIPHMASSLTSSVKQLNKFTEPDEHPQALMLMTAFKQHLCDSPQVLENQNWARAKRVLVSSADCNRDCDSVPATPRKHGLQDKPTSKNNQEDERVHGARRASASTHEKRIVQTLCTRPLASQDLNPGELLLPNTRCCKDFVSAPSTASKYDL